ncbi:MAG: transketolase, partial [Candidatus Angelobacter sp.]
LKDQAALMRGYSLTALCAAGSGHAGGTLSIMDVAAALYLRCAEHDPRNPEWKMRDRIIWSAGHKAPALYTGLAFSGYFAKEDMMTLRKLGSAFQGHPHRMKLPGVEVSTGSLGQGLSIAVGVALAQKMDRIPAKTFCIMGDGEQQEGQIWEAAMEAAHYKLDNLIGIIDQNQLQIDGPVADVMNIDPLDEKYRSFGWHVLRVNGHDMEEIVETLECVKNEPAGRPTMLICYTVKGKGVSFMENQPGWHGRAPNIQELGKALAELHLDGKLPVAELLASAQTFQDKVDTRLEKKMPMFSSGYWWNSGPTMKVEMRPTRAGFGEALRTAGDDPRVCCLGLDISGSITINEFYANNPERKKRWLSMGIAEQSATSVAAGLAREGKLPVFGTYATFAAARNLDQIRTSVCYGNFNVMIAGAHGGVSVGPDGATHQALEDCSAMMSLPNMTVVVPCDAVETRKATTTLLLNHVGPKYIRFAREATPVVTIEDTPFVVGKANVLRLRRESGRMIDAFEHVLAEKYVSEDEDLTIIACGPMVPEAMRAAWILKNEFGYDTRVINMHTLKPLDEAAVVRAASETGIIVTAEEHQIGALAWRVSGVITASKELYGKPVLTGAIGVKDRFGDSGAAWELMREFEVSAEHIAAKSRELMVVKHGAMLPHPSEEFALEEALATSH